MIRGKCTTIRSLALILTLCLGLLLSGCGKETPKVYRVGILIGFIPFEKVADGFKSEMAKLGFKALPLRDVCSNLDANVSPVNPSNGSVIVDIPFLVDRVLVLPDLHTA